ncbi:MAG: adenylate/guanylate cyclase domain-containing protein [Nannocystaceae bacterium]|nr:adenylate/guanylate cyclase domain-containing protein [Nannocystaceae bacterium]
MIDVEPLFDWLVDGTPGATTPAQVVERLCRGAIEAGIPLARTEAFVRTLHPQIVGRSFLWRPGEPVQVRENTYAYLSSPAFANGPVGAVFRSGQPGRFRLDRGEGGGMFGLDELAREGVTDYLAGPLRFMNGQVHAITFATAAAGGFTDEAVAALMRLLRPLSRVAEILALSRTAANLLNTYVGHDAGERILAGKIQRGDSDTIHAALWFSDLRDFTRLSNTVPPAELVRVLNDLFDCQVPAIERHGGEVLKFMGDGLLAIFPLPPDADPGKVTADVLAAAGEAYTALDALNLERSAVGRDPIRFGLALHIGEVAYGNIGGSGRLDFTCIGPAVNLAARLEALSSKLGTPMILSEAFARACTCAVRSLGHFELKGLDAPAEAFAPP